jgi:hypothetical protein
MRITARSVALNRFAWFKQLGFDLGLWSRDSRRCSRLDADYQHTHEAGAQNRCFKFAVRFQFVSPPLALHRERCPVVRRLPLLTGGNINPICVRLASWNFSFHLPTGNQQLRLLRGLPGRDPEKHQYHYEERSLQGLISSSLSK